MRARYPRPPGRSNRDHRRCWISPERHGHRAVRGLAGRARRGRRDAVASPAMRRRRRASPRPGVRSCRTRPSIAPRRRARTPAASGTVRRRGTPMRNAVSSASGVHVGAQSRRRRRRRPAARRFTPMPEHHVAQRPVDHRRLREDPSHLPPPADSARSFGHLHRTVRARRRRRGLGHRGARQQRPGARRRAGSSAGRSTTLNIRARPPGPPSVRPQPAAPLRSGAPPPRASTPAQPLAPSRAPSRSWNR